MFTSLELENFKAFGAKVDIPFAPITLILGENSAGKSSILQALSLLKQTRESRETGVLLLPRSEKGIVDLGSFNEFIFDHDLGRSLSIGLKVALSPQRFEQLRLRFRNIAVNRVGLQITFQRPSSDAEVSLAELKVFWGNNENPLAVFEGTKMAPHFKQNVARRTSFTRGTISKASIAARCSWITSDETFWAASFKNLRNNRSKIAGILEEILKEGSEPLGWRMGLTEREEENNQTRKKFKNQLKDAIKFYSSDFNLSDYTERMKSQNRDITIGLDGFVPIDQYKSPGSVFTDVQLIENTPYRGLGRLLADIVRIASMVGRTVDEEILKLFPMGPSRRSPARWYIFTGTSPQDVGYQGDSMPDFLFRHPDIIEKVNSWLERLEVGYRLQTRSPGPNIRDLFEVRLTDTRRGKPVEVGLPDVGFGVSQLLPFIVQALASEDQVISIEQPEVHIHPRLQADIGDLLAECAKKYNNQFLIETHSEHLVLRLQKLIRDKTLTPEDVSIIFVSRGKEGAKVQRLELDKEGDFIDEWPGGFFPERMREIR